MLVPPLSVATHFSFGTEIVPQGDLIGSTFMLCSVETFEQFAVLGL
jgi:hypothetical protein